ncbi:hypothetical protein [Actinoplanes sp. URMC 104]|uniref:hypothetical protein n=1 Tax=Actinoplanes sp. URMC 104 TaxID=3423409 RepID=UPI003F1D35B7
MARRRRWGKAAADGLSPEERQQLEQDTQLAIYRFQSDAYRNLRHSIAAAVIIFGLFVGSDVFLSNTDGAGLWPRLVLLLSAVLGAGYFATTNSRPRLGIQLLLAAVIVAVIGIALLILLRSGTGS